MKFLNSDFDTFNFAKETLQLLYEFEKWEKEFDAVSDDKYTYNEKAKDVLYEILELRNYLDE